jgi:undecaprenyl pyrophosphate phosphatase UppP
MGGFLLGLEADDFFTPQIWTIIIVILSVIIGFLYLIVNPRINRKKKKPRNKSKIKLKMNLKRIQKDLMKN